MESEMEVLLSEVEARKNTLFGTKVRGVGGRACARLSMLWGLRSAHKQR